MGHVRTGTTRPSKGKRGIGEGSFRIRKSEKEDHTVPRSEKIKI